MDTNFTLVSTLQTIQILLQTRGRCIYSKGKGWQSLILFELGLIFTFITLQCVYCWLFQYKAQSSNTSSDI